MKTLLFFLLLSCTVRGQIIPGKYIIKAKVTTVPTEPAVDYAQGSWVTVDTIPCRITVVKKVHSFSPSKTFDGYKIGKRYYCLDFREVPGYYIIKRVKRK